jgi:hypothetical protein
LIQTFAIRFASPEIAQEYKKEFLKYQEEMSKLMAGLDSSEGAKEAEDISKAVENLEIKETEKKETEQK